MIATSVSVRNGSSHLTFSKKVLLPKVKLYSFNVKCDLSFHRLSVPLWQQNVNMPKIHLAYELLACAAWHLRLWSVKITEGLIEGYPRHSRGWCVKKPLFSHGYYARKFITFLSGSDFLNKTRIPKMKSTRETPERHNVLYAHEQHCFFD